MQDLLVGSSAVFSNKNIVDRRVFEKFGLRSLEVRGACRRTDLRLFGFGN